MQKVAHCFTLATCLVICYISNFLIEYAKNMEKKTYNAPHCTVLITQPKIICMSIHDEDAPFAGAKQEQFFFEDAAMPQSDTQGTGDADS